MLVSIVNIVGNCSKDALIHSISSNDTILTDGKTD